MSVTTTPVRPDPGGTPEKPAGKPGWLSRGRGIP